MSNIIQLPKLTKRQRLERELGRVQKEFDDVVAARVRRGYITDDELRLVRRYNYLQDRMRQSDSALAHWMRHRELARA